MRLSSLEDLVAAGLVSAPAQTALAPVAARYSIGVSATLAQAIRAEDAQGPIARQFLPDVSELQVAPQELVDPIGDDAHAPAPGIVHRYRDRALLKLLTICPVYCRFCFRREQVGARKGGLLSPAETQAAFAYLEGAPEISQVILTGGDPFALSPRRLRMALARLAQIAHVKILRIHTRAPLAAPELVTNELVNALAACGDRPLFIAIHANHAREFTPAGLASLARLRQAGAQLISQSVLLRGVNDNVDALVDLMGAFVAAGVKPYYLHHPDLAPGTSHFRLTLEKGRALYNGLRQRAGGLLTPTYVLDIPGGFGKIPIDDDHLARVAGGYEARDRTGRRHFVGP
jgi:lysine 2,3-aminomutase